MIGALRDAPFGQVVRFVTKGKYFKYPEEEEGFQLPAPWLEMLNNPEAGLEHTADPTPNTVSSSASTVNNEKPVDPAAPAATEKENVSASGEGSSDNTATPPTASNPIRDEEIHRTTSHGGGPAMNDARLAEDEMHEISRTKSVPIVPKVTKSGAILVDWYYTDDPANPHNWSNRKRLFLTLIICFYTFVVYTTSAIYTSSVPQIQERFGVDNVLATLGLSLYVLGYGVGPLIFSPLSEIPRIGRNPVYIITMFLFVVLSIPTALVDNFAGLMVLRFITGFFGSPCLASGGASLGDMYSLMNLPYAMMAWVSAAYCGRKYPLHTPYHTLAGYLKKRLTNICCSCSRPSPLRLRRPS
jgi:DHA1 family multidrug resistance protein-like MFS transporter